MSKQGQRFEFGEYVLDAEEKVLQRDGKMVAVPPKILELLLVLIQSHGHTVGKEDLMSRLWPDTYVEDSNLTFSIRKLRTILGDDTQNPRFIETVPKRGYRFVADAIENGDRAIVEPDAADVNGPANGVKVEKSLSAVGSSKNFYILTALAFAVLIFGLGTAIWWYAADRNSKPVLSKIERLTYNGKVKLAAISPDGKFAAYVVDDESKQSIWVKNVATGSDLQILPAAEGVELHGILFSPGGDQIYYVARDSLYQLPILGGLPKEVLHNFAAGLLYKSIALSPDGKQFAFIRPISKTESVLVIVNADGSNEHVLASSEGKNMFRRSVCWSPDGKKIALIAMGNANINIVNVADGSVSSLPAPPWKTVWRIAWRSDGNGLIAEAVEGRSLASQIWSLSYPDGTAEGLTNDFNNYDGITATAGGDVIATVRVEQSAHIWVTQADGGGNFQQLTHGIEGYDGIYTLNYLAGGEIIYDVTAGEKRDVWSIPADGVAARQILNNAGSSGASPDGRYIVYQHGEGNETGLFRYDIRGGENIRLTTGNDTWTAFSPDSKWVVYTRWKADATIWKVPTDGGEAVQLSNQTGYALAPTISPDGKMIAFHWAKPDRTKTAEIAVIPFDGGDLIKTFPVPPKWSVGITKHAMQWTPDSQAINYAVFRDNASNIWRQPIDGSPAVQVTNFADQQIFNFAYSPDGKRLALSRGTYRRDAVLLKFDRK